MAIIMIIWNKIWNEYNWQNLRKQMIQELIGFLEEKNLIVWKTKQMSFVKIWPYIYYYSKPVKMCDSIIKMPLLNGADFKKVLILIINVIIGIK